MCRFILLKIFGTVKMDTILDVRLLDVKVYTFKIFWDCKDGHHPSPAANPTSPLPCPAWQESQGRETCRVSQSRQ